MYICSKSKIQQMHETKGTLEILIATMNRSNLDFLGKIFPYDYAHLNLIIVNQTTAGKTISNNKKNIKVINSFEKGLSKSRNLALKNAITTYCLIIDDDVVLLKGFENTILEAYDKNPDKAIISFQTLTPEGNLSWNYPTKSGYHKRLDKILSLEITFNREIITKNNISFDEQFGLGTIFQDSENYIFLKEIEKKIEKPYFYKKSIVIHPELTSSDEIVSDRHTFARAALLYKYKKNIAYLYIVKLIFFLLRTKRISIKEIPNKWSIAVRGIKKYKELNHA